MSHSNRTVLVVDDDRSLVQFTTTILEHEGYIVRTACNGQEALNRAIESLPDIILLDLRMPIMDGWTCYHLLKQREDTANIPIIVISADEVEEKVHSDLGGAHFLPKPFDIDDLLNNIRTYLGLTVP